MHPEIMNRSPRWDGFITHGAKHDKQTLVSGALGKEWGEREEMMEDNLHMHPACGYFSCELD